MPRKPLACIVGAYEHPTRYAPEKSVAQLQMECARGALDDCGLTFNDVDGLFCGGEVPGQSPAYLADYMNIRPAHVDGTELGGCSYIAHVGKAVEALAAGRCSVALVTLAGAPRSRGQATGTEKRVLPVNLPSEVWDNAYGWNVIALYATYAQRHMHEFGTTSEQLAWVKVTASQHAQHNPHAMLREPVDVAQVLASPLIAHPLHRLDCCVISDGGGALVLTLPEIARRISRPSVGVVGYGASIKTNDGGMLNLTSMGAEESGAQAFAAARVKPSDIKYASIYDNFTISVVMQLEDLGFCEKGEGGRFASDGNLIAGVGRLPINTDGGGLCNNHPQNRGGITKVIEAVRQLRGEAHPAVQVKNCDLALATGPGLLFGAGHAHSTVILERLQ